MPWMTSPRGQLRAATVPLLMALAMAAAPWTAAEPLAAGSPAPAIDLRDQHDQPVVIDRQTAHLVFAAERAVSEWVNQALAAQASGALERVRAVYVADISGMPALITNAFALPKWQRLPFRIGLARHAAQVADIPRQPGHATVLSLQDGTVVQLRHAADAAQLRQWLGLPPP
jgi:hypothetical protein